MFWLNIILGALGIYIIASGIRTVRPTQRALVERLGKYLTYKEPGFHIIIPVIDQMIKVNVTERMMDIEPQDIITKDNLNARVDLMVYYQVKPDEENLKKSRYNVEEFESQIVSLAQTTARNVIGDMVFKDVNSKRNTLNQKLCEVLDKESDDWGVRVVRVEMKEITPPEDVQETMNKVIKAENEKDAAKDLAEATETRADGERRAAIKVASGEKDAMILRADGQKQATVTVAQGVAQKIKLENEALQTYFKGNAQVYEKLATAQVALKNNAKYVIEPSTGIVNVISDVAGITPIGAKAETAETPTGRISRKQARERLDGPLSKN